MIQFNNPNSEYHLFNFLIFLCIVLMVLLLKMDVIALKCVYAEIGMQCKTCGLTRSFKRLLDGDTNGIPSGHILLFVLFASQLIIRPVISWRLERDRSNKKILVLDIILSLVIVIWTMKELLWE